MARSTRDDPEPPPADDETDPAPEPEPDPPAADDETDPPEEPMAQAIPSTTDEMLVSCTYDSTGLAYVNLIDNHLIGWVVDTTMPPESPPAPAVVGGLPAAAPDTDPVISPQWVVVVRSLDGATLVPGTWRGTFFEFLTWIATNNGASRRVGGSLLRHQLLTGAFSSWAAVNPDLVWTGG